MIKLFDEINSSQYVNIHREPKFIKYGRHLFNVNNIAHIYVCDFETHVENRKIEQHYITFTFIGSQFDDYDLKITFNSSEELQEFLNDFYKIVPVVEIGGVENE